MRVIAGRPQIPVATALLYLPLNTLNWRSAEVGIHGRDVSTVSEDLFLFGLRKGVQ